MRKTIILMAVALISCKKENIATQNKTTADSSRTDAFMMMIHDTSYAGYAPYLGDYKAIFYPNQEHSFLDSVRISVTTFTDYYTYASTFSYAMFASTRTIALDSNKYAFIHYNPDNRIDFIISDCGGSSDPGLCDTHLDYSYFSDGSISGFNYDGAESHDAYTVAITSSHGDTSIAHWHFYGDGSEYERDDTMIYYPQMNNTNLLTLSGVQWGGQYRLPVAYTTPFPNLHMRLIKEIKYIVKCEYTFDSKGRVVTAMLFYFSGYNNGKTVVYSFTYPE